MANRTVGRDDGGTWSGTRGGSGWRSCASAGLVRRWYATTRTRVLVSMRKTTEKRVAFGVRREMEQRSNQETHVMHVVFHPLA
jgi:hypothetical protein